MNSSAKITRVKVCGITQPQQASAVAQMGVHAIGMIMHAKSPRLVSVEQAKLIRAAVPPFVQLVGVFVDASAEQINDVARAVGLNLIQLHGDEPSELAQQLFVPSIKAIRAQSQEVVSDAIKKHSTSLGFLVDPYHPDHHGGTGMTLDHQYWPQLDENLGDRPLILAGGLGPSNLAQALQVFKPYAVDLNSGVESAPGVKDLKKLAEALQIVTAHNEQYGES